MPRQNTLHTTFPLCWVLLSRPALILPARKPNGWYALSRNYAKNVQLVSHGRKWKKIGGVGGWWRGLLEKRWHKEEGQMGRETRKLTDLRFRPRAEARREQDGDMWQDNRVQATLSPSVVFLHWRIGRRRSSTWRRLIAIEERQHDVGNGADDNKS